MSFRRIILWSQVEVDQQTNADPKFPTMPVPFTPEHDQRKAKEGEIRQALSSYHHLIGQTPHAQHDKEHHKERDHYETGSNSAGVPRL